MSRKKFQLLLPLFALMLAALACGGSSPVTIDEIPVFPGATALQSGESPMADQLAQVVAESAGEEDVRSDIRLYSVPAGTTWEQIREYYTSELSGTDWEQDTQLDQNSEFFQSMGWTRGSLSSEQALVVGFTQDPFSGDSILMISLFSE